MLIHPYLFFPLLLLLPLAASHFSPAHIRCTNRTLPTPSYGLHDNPVFTVCSELAIHAPLPLIYSALLNFSAYHAWNTFVIAVALPANIITPQDVAVGLVMNFTTTGLVPGVNTSSTEVVSVLEPPGRKMRHGLVAWGSEDMATQFKAEHPTILTDVGGGWTRSVSYETYYGAGATAILPLKANLQREFEVENEDLKRLVEGLW